MDNVLTVPAMDNPLIVDARKRVQTATNLVDDLTVESQEDYEFAAGQLKTIKALANSLEDGRKTITAPLRAATEATNAMFRPYADRLTDAERILKGKMLKFRQAEDAKREAEIERQRIERRREEAAAQDALQDALAAGDTEAANVASQKIEGAILAPVVARPAVSASGTSVSKRWKGEVTDMVAFLAHAVKPGNENLLACVEIRQGDLNTIVRLAKGNITAPGLRTFEESTMSVR